MLQNKFLTFFLIIFLIFSYCSNVLGYDSIYGNNKKIEIISQG